MKTGEKNYFYILLISCILFTAYSSCSDFEHKMPISKVMIKNSSRKLPLYNSQNIFLTITHASYNIVETTISLEFNLSCLNKTSIRTPTTNLFEYEVTSSTNKIYRYPNFVQNAFETYNFKPGIYNYSTDLSLYALNSEEDQYKPEYFDIIVSINSRSSISDQCRILKADNYYFAKQLSLSDIFRIIIIKNWFLLSILVIEVVVLMKLVSMINKKKMQ